MVIPCFCTGMGLSLAALLRHQQIRKIGSEVTETRGREVLLMAPFIPFVETTCAGPWSFEGTNLAADSSTGREENCSAGGGGG